MRSAKRNEFDHVYSMFIPCLVSCTEQFPLAVQIIFQKKQMLQVLREFLKCRGVVVNSKQWIRERRLKPVLLQGLTVNFVVFAVDQNIFD